MRVSRIQFFIASTLFFTIIIHNKFKEPSSKSSFDTKEIENSNTVKSLNNIPGLFRNLAEADKEWKPRRLYKVDGSIQYVYRKLPGELELSLEEIENRIVNFNDLFIKERQDIKDLLKVLNNAGVSVVFYDLSKNKSSKGASGLWVPGKATVILDPSLIRYGSLAFHDVLSHESVHVAQSCFAGSIYAQPQRIGLPLAFSRSINNSISHQLYSHHSQSNIYVEQEAYSYSNKIGSAVYLIKNYCMQKI